MACRSCKQSCSAWQDQGTGLAAFVVSLSYLQHWLCISMWLPLVCLLLGIKTAVQGRRLNLGRLHRRLLCGRSCSFLLSAEPTKLPVVQRSAGGTCRDVRGSRVQLPAAHWCARFVTAWALATWLATRAAMPSACCTACTIDQWCGRHFCCLTTCLDPATHIYILLWRP
jgi:hypothetical protein